MSVNFLLSFDNTFFVVFPIKYESKLKISFIFWPQVDLITPFTSSILIINLKKQERIKQNDLLVRIMKKFSLPNEFHNVDWKTKHNLVKKFINEYKNTKKELLDRGGRFKWNTSAVLELLTLLNLEPLVKNFEYKAYYTPFNVRCSIHNHTFDTRFELISKGQICSYCLSTVKGFSQFILSRICKRNMVRYSFMSILPYP